MANNLIRAYSPSISEDVYFTATTLTGTATKVQIEGTSGTQYAQTNAQPVDTLTVVVSDANNNPITNKEVTFKIEQGDAYFKASSALAGQLQATDQAIQTTTDNKGQASVRPYIGTTASTIVITATTTDENNQAIGNARFNIIALQRSDGPTSLTGIAMDHTGTPLAGIQFSIARTQLTAISDAQGHFQFPSQVPAGKIDLFVDGRNVQTQQTVETVEYPALHFETAIIQGQNNQLPHPVYLPPVHIENTQTVGGNQDVTLTLPNFDGFKMIVKANSVTFPDGSTQGELVVNPVNNDRLPMVPPGTGGKFMATGWTLQPSGTRFDPPIEVHIPNTDGLSPGTVVPVVQWDHDMAFFVPMGLGTISEDGSELVTNTGSGITKAGWGGGQSRITPNNTCFLADETRLVWNTFGPYLSRFHNPVLRRKLGRTRTYQTNISSPLFCKQCDSNSNWKISGGISYDSKSYVAINIPDYSQPNTYVDLDDDFITSIDNHEFLHAQKMRDLHINYDKNIEGEWSSLLQCKNTISNAEQEFSKKLNIEVYRQCMHLDHSEFPRYAIGRHANLVIIGYYPLKPVDAGYDFCQSLPPPHE